MVVQVCEECGAEFPIWRRKSRLKDDDHVKHLYCPTCKRVTAHKEAYGFDENRLYRRVHKMSLDEAMEQALSANAKIGGHGSSLTEK